MIVDAHSHIGYSPVFANGIDEAGLLAAMDANGIDAAVVMPAAGSDPAAMHDRIARLAEAASRRIFGMISIPPLVGEKTYARLFRRALDHGFVGVKLHPLAHVVAPTHPAADIVFQLAAEANIPVMIHTGLGAPLALPALIIPRARQYPHLRIIQAHAGFGIYTAEAIVVSQECPNVLLEPSWCNPVEIKRMITMFGPERVMFGGDVPLNIASELAKYRSIGLSDDQLNKCLAQTAIDVFGLPLNR